MAMSPRRLAMLAMLAAVLPATSPAGTLRERIRDRIEARAEARGADADADANDDYDELAAGTALRCADWARRVRPLEQRATKHFAWQPGDSDVAYGPEPLATFDVYAPARRQAKPAPIIVMVHGGGWCVGDKRNAKVIRHKVGRWLPKGFVFISANYPMVGEGADALAQAGHVAKAIAYVQAHAGDWGGDGDRVILMGHSAGAHLASLVGADAALRERHGVRPLLGTVSLDAGAIDVVTQMPHVYPFLKTRYREAFGEREAQWIAASPFHRLDRHAAPWLGVCSTTRKDQPCAQAQAYADKSKALGVRADVLPEPMNHGAINATLGTPGDYTDRVEAFMAALDPVVAARLGRSMAQ